MLASHLVGGWIDVALAWATAVFLVIFVLAMVFHAIRFIQRVFLRVEHGSVDDTMTRMDDRGFFNVHGTEALRDHHNEGRRDG